MRLIRKLLGGEEQKSESVCCPDALACRTCFKRISNKKQFTDDTPSFIDYCKEVGRTALRVKQFDHTMMRFCQHERCIGLVYMNEKCTLKHSDECSICMIQLDSKSFKREKLREKRTGLTSVFTRKVRRKPYTLVWG